MRLWGCFGGDDTEVWLTLQHFLSEVLYDPSFRLSGVGSADWHLTAIAVERAQGERMSSSHPVIDVHEHYVAAAHIEALRDLAGPLDDGIPLPNWTAEKSLAVMDEIGIEASILSPVSPPPAYRDEAHARAVSRAVNEELAAVVASHPTRYGAVAMLPLPFLDAALDELAYALDVLSLDGAHLYSSYAGRYLGNSEFRPLLVELDRRAVTVVTHPTTPAGSETVSMGRPTPTLEFPFDTTRTTGDLLYSGALEAFPHISWILPHGGGALLQMGDRLARTVHILREETNLVLPGLPQTDDAARGLIRNLHFDVCWNTYEPVLGALAEMSGTSQLLYGTDRPFEHSPYLERDLSKLESNRGVDDDARQAIRRDNALRLFPGLAARLASTATSPVTR
jgi:predicted TIM-barrel fold metal-dependent hydrolase